MSFSRVDQITQTSGKGIWGHRLRERKSSTLILTRRFSGNRPVSVSSFEIVSDRSRFGRSVCIRLRFAFSRSLCRRWGSATRCRFGTSLLGSAGRLRASHSSLLLVGRGWHIEKAKEKKEKKDEKKTKWDEENEETKIRKTEVQTGIRWRRIM